jgi:tetratricopeptide (TPR) repeat protein
MRRFKLLFAWVDATGMRTAALAILCLVATLAATTSAESLEEALARSEAAYAEGQLEAAVAILKARLENPPPGENLVPVHGTLGDLYLEMANADKALEHFDWIAAEHPRYARAHFKRGLALEQRSRSKEAIDAFALAGEQYYDEAEVRTRIGFNYMVLASAPDTPAEERPRYGELARKSLTRAIKLNPRDHSALGNLADIVFNLGDFESALAFYQRMDTMEPSRPMTLARIGSTYLQMGQHEPALENLRRAAKILDASQPRTESDALIYRDVEAFSRVRAAECLIKLERPHEARDEIARVLKIVNCSDCKLTSREIDRSKSRAETLLAEIDGATPANAKPPL